ncbi:peptidase A2 domain-containing protein [Trichonephila clavipes]|nr:peptidase A2 domain-containing protein [Trichonephila clavipes]
MAFLLSKKKEDLIELAEELGLIVEAGLTKPKLKDLIVKSPDYVEEDVKVMFDSIVKDRIRTEEKEEKLRQEREYELEKLRIQAEKNVNTMNNSENAQAPKLIHETFHKFNMKDDISLNLTLFERHAELTFLPMKDWVQKLIGLIPIDIAHLIAREPADKCNDYNHVKSLLLKSSPAEIAEKFEEYESVRRTLRPKFYNSFAKGRYEASGSNDTYFQRTEYLQGGISLIREDVSKGIIEPSKLSKDIAVLIGLGKYEVKTKGSFQRKIELDEEEYSLTWHVVPTPSLEFQAVIGSDILEQASVCFYKESVQFRKHEDKNCFLQMQVYEAEVEDEIVVQHVTNPRIRRQLLELISNYEPKKTETTNVCP